MLHIFEIVDGVPRGNCGVIPAVIENQLPAPARESREVRISRVQNEAVLVSARRTVASSSTVSVFNVASSKTI